MYSKLFYVQERHIIGTYYTILGPRLQSLLDFFMYFFFLPLIQNSVQNDALTNQMSQNENCIKKVGQCNRGQYLT